jgi:hypothetical protein
MIGLQNHEHHENLRSKKLIFMISSSLVLPKICKFRFLHQPDPTESIAPDFLFHHN